MPITLMAKDLVLLFLWSQRWQWSYNHIYDIHLPDQSLLDSFSKQKIKTLTRRNKRANIAPPIGFPHKSFFKSIIQYKLK